MAAKRSQPARRKPRMDAQRNRERILEVAKEAFARSGASTSLGREIVRPVQISNESGPGWAPSESLLGLRARTDKVATNEHPYPAKMGCCHLGGFGHDRHLQAAADGLSDVPKRHSLFGDRVMPGPCFLLLERQPVEAGSVEDVHGRPAVESVAHVR